MARIVVCGYMVRLPVAGMMLAFAQYLLGFRRLGHEVLYVEELGWPDSCYDPASQTYSNDPTAGMQAVRRLLDAVGCDCPIAFVDAQHDLTYGIERRTLDQYFSTADVVFNVGGVCWLECFQDVSHVALIDMDPLFTQAGSFAKEGFDKYTSCFTYGTNVGHETCTIPTAEADWRPTLPPVVPDLWRLPEPIDDHREFVFTTIANWSAYGGIEWQGEHFGQKDEQFLELLELPQMIRPKLRLAVSGMPGDVAKQFRAAGWELMDASVVSETFDRYQSFIQNSSGEFSVAKHGYVKGRTGWISDRTVCYLAAGRPAVVQDTGVPAAIRSHPGWTSFSNLAEAAELLNRVSQDYRSYQQEAIRLAEEVFSYERVLPELLEKAVGQRGG